MGSLACRNCGSLETKVCPAEDAGKVSPDVNSRMQASGFISAESFKELLKLLPLVFGLLGRFFGFLEQREKNKGMVVVCTKCRYWERI